jgi:uncharacterized lipoprotein YajG
MGSTLLDLSIATKVDIRTWLKEMLLVLATTLVLKADQLTTTTVLVVPRHPVLISNTTETFKVFTKDRRRIC